MKHGRRYTARGIILKRSNYGEADRIITLLCEKYGKIQLLAKGVRKVPSKRAGYLEVFSYVTVGIHVSKTFHILTEVDRLDMYTFESSSLDRISHAYYMCELVDRLVPPEAEQDTVLELLSASLQDIRACGSLSECSNTIHIFALSLLKELGYLPRDRSLSKESVEPFIENIIERKLKTTKILTTLRKQT